MSKHKYTYAMRAEHIVKSEFPGGREPSTRSEWMEVVRRAYEKGYASGTAKYRARMIAARDR